MVVTFEQWLLADSARGRKGPTVLSIQGARDSLSQVARLPRATSIRQFDRGNQTNVIRFTTQEEESSPARAQAKVLYYVRNIPTFGSFQLLAGLSYVTLRLFLKQAKLSITDYSTRGSTILMSFQVEGGAWEEDD